MTEDHPFIAPSAGRKILGLFLCLGLGCKTPIHAQTGSASSLQGDYDVYRVRTLSITIGAAMPQAKTGLRQFWLTGPSGSLNFMVNVNPHVALGIGADVSLFYFDRRAFSATYPGVSIRSKDITTANLYVTWKYSPLPRYRTSPFVGMSAGALFWSEARYREVVNGVRVTYYEVGGSPRLTLGVEAGTTIHISRKIALEVELRPTYIHNDPNGGVILFARGGVQITV